MTNLTAVGAIKRVMEEFGRQLAREMESLKDLMYLMRGGTIREFVITDQYGHTRAIKLRSGAKAR